MPKDVWQPCVRILIEADFHLGRLRRSVGPATRRIQELCMVSPELLSGGGQTALGSGPSRAAAPLQRFVRRANRDWLSRFKRDVLVPGFALLSSQILDNTIQVVVKSSGKLVASSPNVLSRCHWGHRSFLPVLPVCR